MKKKYFFKFFLFTVFATLVTFTACKDYDDDISRLESEISTLKGMSTDLTAIKADVAAAQTAANNALAKANEALEAAQGTGDAAAVEAAQEAADKAQAKADEVETKATELEGLIEALEGRIATLEALDSPSKEDLEALDADMKEIVLKLEALVGKNLRSLVLIPHYYVNGVEAIGFNPLAYICGGDYGDDYSEAYNEMYGRYLFGGAEPVSTRATAGDILKANPNIVEVQYHVNPSSVTEDMIDVDNLSFIYKLQNHKTRSADINAKAEFVSLENGILTVRVDLDANEAEDGGMQVAPWGFETMDMIALQVPLSEEAKEDDADYEAVITSDWARVDVEDLAYPRIDRIGKLCDEDLISYTEDYPTVQEAIDMVDADKPYLLELVYDKKHNLLDYVTSTALSMSGCEEFDAADYGLVWNFDLLDENGDKISYLKDSNETEQQEYINLLDNEGNVEARVYDAEPGAGVTNAIGRTPIVRMQLIDSATDCVVTYGFVKIKWVKEQPVFDAEYPAEDVDFSCEFAKDDTGADLEYSAMGLNIKTKWMNVNVMNAMGTYYTEFIHNYTLDESGLYDVNGDLLVDEDAWGVVVPNPDAQTEQPEVTDLFSVYLENTCEVSDETTFTGYVHYTDAVTGEVALRIKVTMNINMPELTVAGHNNFYWQGGNNSSNVFNVNPVQFGTDPQNMPTAVYRTDLLNGFTNGTTYTDDIKEIVKSSIAGHEPCGIEFVFDAEALKDYSFVIGTTTYSIDDENLRVANEGTQLQFHDGNDWVVASDIVEYVEMPGLGHAGQAIRLNSDDPTSNEANVFAQALIGEKVPVKLAADLCCETECENFGRDIRKFEVYFIPPMHINSTFTETFVDWVTGGDYINLDEAFTLTDFADYLVALTTPTNPTEKEKWAADLWGYYVIDNVTWNVANATSNIGNVDGDLDVVPGAKNALPENYVITYVNVSPNENSLRFQNNSGAPLAKEFELYVPVTVDHKWGTLTTTVTIKVLPPQE